MNILYIAGYTSPSFLSINRDDNTPNLGGMRKVELICSILANAGHNVIVLSSAMLSNSRIAIRHFQRECKELDNGKNVRIDYPAAFMLRPFGGLINCIRARSIAKTLLKDFVPDLAIIYNTYLFESLASMELVNRTIPIILEIEDLPLARSRGVLNIKPRLDQMCWDLMLQKASAFTAVNQPIYDLLPSGKPKLLLPGIIDQDLVECSKQRRNPYSKEIKTLGYFGALTHGKGVSLLLELVPLLSSSWQLIVTGSGPLSASFERLSNEYPDRMRFLGSVDKRTMYEAMCGCDCLVIPPENIANQGEGVFPFKTFEYAVSGAHVISVKLPLHDLTNKTLFFQRWDGSLNALLHLINQSQSDYEKERETRNELSKHIMDNFSTYSIAGKLNNIFDTVL
jgi:glycosyltransferase involved in cell wall biosynthesis